MADREKIVKVLEIQLDDLQKYADSDEILTLTQEQVKEIVALLKEQKAVKPRVSSVEQRCGKCNKVIEMDGWKACPWCGKPIDWEGWWLNDRDRAEGFTRADERNENDSLQ